MRPLVTIAALLLAFAASAQTPPAAEATAPAAEPKKEVKKSEDGPLTLKSGANTLRLYLLIDATIGTSDNANAAGDRVTGARTAWFSGNRWGLQGKHVVSDDLSVIAKLESEYTVADGAMDTPNVLFNRDAWVGFDSKLHRPAHLSAARTPWPVTSRRTTATPTAPPGSAWTRAAGPTPTTSST